MPAPAPSAWWDAALAVVVGSRCAGCRRPGRPWCDTCHRELPQEMAPCEVDTQIVAVLPYSARVAGAVVAFKDDGVGRCGPLLAAALAAGLDHAADVWDLPAPTMVVAAPTRPASRRARGFDHARWLADHAVAMLGDPRFSVRGVLRLHRPTPLHPHRLHARAGNGVSTVIVDDVYTTGATIDRCRQALSAAGHDVRGAVTIASPQRS